MDGRGKGGKTKGVVKWQGVWGCSSFGYSLDARYVGSLLIITLITLLHGFYIRDPLAALPYPRSIDGAHFDRVH